MSEKSLFDGVPVVAQDKAYGSVAAVLARAYRVNARTPETAMVAKRMERVFQLLRRTWQVYERVRHGLSPSPTALDGFAGASGIW